MKKNFWVLLYQGQWAVKREGSQTPSGVYRSLQEAIESAKALARTSGVELRLGQEVDRRARNRAPEERGATFREKRSPMAAS